VKQSDYAKQFPQQTPMDGTPIPSLFEIAALVEKAGNQSVSFNRECTSDNDSVGYS
jgi:hypothetical protein